MYPKSEQHFRNSSCCHRYSMSRLSLPSWHVLKIGRLWFSKRRWDFLSAQPEGDFCCNVSEVERHMKEWFDPAMYKKYCHQLYRKQNHHRSDTWHCISLRKQFASLVWKPWPMKMQKSFRKTYISFTYQPSVRKTSSIVTHPEQHRA